MAKLYLDDTVVDTNDYKEKKPEVPAEEPGWFQPGSKSDAAVRGFANGATFGLAPRISAGVNSMFGDGTFKDNLSQYLKDNKTAEAAHPVISTATNLAASAPSLIATGAGSIPAMAGKSALLSGADTFGNSDASGMDLAKDVAVGSAVGGTVGAALPLVGKAGGAAYDFFKGTPNKQYINEAAKRFNQPTVEGAVAEHNARNAKKIAANTTDVIRDTIAGGAAAGGATFIATDGDWDKTGKAGLAGAVGTGLYKKSGKGIDATKLRMPDTRGPGVLGNAIDKTLTPLRVAGEQDLSGHIRSNIGASPFSRLTDFLSQSDDTTNPEVQQQAEQAQQQVDPNDPDSKRKAAMNLQTTPSGRAVGNSDSKFRYLDE
jgi:hypothetical protein